MLVLSSCLKKTPSAVPFCYHSSYLALISAVKCACRNWMVPGKKMTLLKDNVLIANNTIVWNPENEICTLVLCCSAALMWWRWGQKKKIPGLSTFMIQWYYITFLFFWLSSILQTPLTIAARLINFNGNGSKAKVKRWRKYSNNGPTLVSQAYAKRQKIPQYDAHFSYGVSHQGSQSG